MNHIDVKPIKTHYDYYEDYWIIDGVPIVSYVEQYRPGSSLSVFGSLLGLLPAWSGKLVCQWENDFIWEMVNSKVENTVYWDRIGVLNHSNMDCQEYKQSGILCLEAYSEEDWQKYGDNIAVVSYGSSEYWIWVNENFYEESIRRLRNYLKPYMQKEQNIELMWCPGWAFEKAEYEAMIQKYQRLKNTP